MAEAAFLHAALTAKQRQTLAAIDALQQETGYSPTVREIQERTFTASPSNVHERLVALRERGLVTWVEDSPRTLVVTKAGRKAL